MQALQQALREAIPMGTGDGPIRDSNAEYVLRSLESTIANYQLAVGEKVDAVRDDLREHNRAQLDWQRQVEGDLRRAFSVEQRVGTLEERLDKAAKIAEAAREIKAIVPKVSALEKTVGDHSNLLERTKGAVMGARTMWAVFALAAAGNLGWIWTLLAPNNTRTGITVAPAYVATAPTPNPYSPATSASSSLARPCTGRSPEHSLHSPRRRPARSVRKQPEARHAHATFHV